MNPVVAGVSYSAFVGDREAKTCDVFLDGVLVGMIVVVNDEEFQGPATMRRTMRFTEVTVDLYGNNLGREGRDASFSAVDGYTRDTGVRAAKALMTKWLTL